MSIKSENSSSIIKLAGIALLSMGVVSMVGCDDSPSAENAGESIDRGIDNTGDAIDDGMDDASDAIDDAFDDVDNDPIVP